MYNIGCSVNTGWRRRLRPPYHVRKPQIIQRKEKLFHHWVRRASMVYALQKYRYYFLGGHFNMYTYHSTHKYLVNNPVLVGHIWKWILLFQEYDFEVVVKPRRLNTGPNHLSHIETGEEPTSLEEGLLDVQLFSVHITDVHFEDIIHFLAIGTMQKG